MAIKHPLTSDNSEQEIQQNNVTYAEFTTGY